jgi:glycosyltransferase involved in cell wall biosynthesis
MKVCLITPKYPPNIQGGGEISIRLLAEQLASRTDIDELVVMSFDGECEEEINGVHIKRIAEYSETPLEISNIKVLIQLLKYQEYFNRFDIIHGYNVYYFPALGVISQLLSLPTVGTLNSYVLLPESASGFTATGARRVYDRIFMPTTGRVLRWTSRYIDKFICLSDGSKRVYVESGFNGQDIKTIPNMVDPSFNVPPVSRDNKKTRVLYVGSLTEYKGVKYLVSAASNLPTDFEIRIIGDGEQRAELEKFASEIDVDTKVNFVGDVLYSEIKFEYAKADVFVHPGVWPEPFGRTIIEAMEAGLPVVATNIGGPPDIVNTEELLCPPANASALANAIEYAIKHRDTIGTQNQTRVAKQYAPGRICDRIISLYKEVLEGP